MRQRIIASWRAWFATVLLCLHAVVAQAVPPESGWWWNPEENGRGFFIEVADGVLFMAAYFYEEDGRSTWLVSGGPLATDSSYTGRLFRVSGGQALFGPYQAPSGSDVGEVTLAFSDPTHAALTWPGGVTPIERQIIGVLTPDFDPTGWWWNPDQSGRGYAVEVRGNTLFMAAYAYNDAGQPLWYISSGPMSTATHFEGTLLEIGGGQTLDGPYQAPTSSTPVGTVTIDFDSLDEATFALSDVVPPAAATSSKLSNKRIEIIRNRRQLRRTAAPRPDLLPNQLMFEGRIVHHESFHNLIAALDTTFNYEGTRLRWIQGTGYDDPVPLAPPPDLGAGTALHFYLSEGSTPIKFVFTEVAVGVCTATASYTRPLTANDGQLWVNLTTRRYQGELRMFPFGVIDWVRVCPNFTQRWQQLISQVQIKFEGTGILVPPQAAGQPSGLLLKADEPEPPQQSNAIFQIITGNWNFALIQ